MGCGPQYTTTTHEVKYCYHLPHMLVYEFNLKIIIKWKKKWRIKCTWNKVIRMEGVLAAILVDTDMIY